MWINCPFYRPVRLLRIFQLFYRDGSSLVFREAVLSSRWKPLITFFTDRDVKQTVRPGGTFIMVLRVPGLSETSFLVGMNVSSELVLHD